MKRILFVSLILISHNFYAQSFKLDCSEIKKRGETPTEQHTLFSIDNSAIIKLQDNKDATYLVKKHYYNTTWNEYVYKINDSEEFTLNLDGKFLMHSYTKNSIHYIISYRKCDFF